MTETERHKVSFTQRAEFSCGWSDACAPEGAGIVIGLHGYGESGDRMADFTAAVAGDRYLYASPNAPHQFYHYRDAWKDPRVGFSWITRHDRDGGLDACEEYIRGIVDLLVTSRGADGNNIVLVGFSQGVSVSYTLGFRLRDRVRAVAVIGATRPKYQDEFFRAHAAEAPRLFIAQGLRDEITPPDSVAPDVDFFTAIGCKVTHKTYDAAHVRTPEMSTDIDGWLAAPAS